MMGYRVLGCSVRQDVQPRPARGQPWLWTARTQVRSARGNVRKPRARTPAAGAPADAGWSHPCGTGSHGSGRSGEQQPRLPHPGAHTREALSLSQESEENAPFPPGVGLHQAASARALLGGRTWSHDCSHSRRAVPRSGAGHRPPLRAQVGRMMGDVHRATRRPEGSTPGHLFVRCQSGPGSRLPAPRGGPAPLRVSEDVLILHPSRGLRQTFCELRVAVSTQWKGLGQ